MANAAKSAYLQTYDEETKHDDYKFEMKNAQAKVSFSDSKLDRALEFKSGGGYKFKFGATLQSEFDLKAKLDEIEGDVDDLEADPASANNAAGLAQEIVDRQSADTVLTNGAAAEVARATTAETTNAALVAAEAVTSRAAESVNAAAVVSASSTAAAATASEAVTARAAEANLQLQITNLLSEVDGGTISSIAELLAHANAADTSLLASISTLQTNADLLLARVDILTNE